MKILVFSDSHGRNELMSIIIEHFKEEVNTVLFLGDCVPDFTDFQYIYTDKVFLSVNGNCDFDSYEPTERLLDIAGKKIFMTHGHNFGVKSNHTRILNEALKLKASVCLYGHSHRPEAFKEQGVYLMNPGSISEPRYTDYPTFGVINIKDTLISLNIFLVEEKGILPYRTID